MSENSHRNTGVPIGLRDTEMARRTPVENMSMRPGKPTGMQNADIADSVGPETQGDASNAFDTARKFQK